MNTTRILLLNSLVAGESEVWVEADSLYRPLIRVWLRRFSLNPDEIDDVTQEVMSVVVSSISDFEHNGHVGAFRNWLRTTTVNMARSYLRKRNIARGSGSTKVMELLAELEAPNSSLSAEFDREHDRHVMQVLFDRLESQFEPITLSLFCAHVIEHCTAQETATRFGVSVASVHTAKSRVLRRLRKDATQWLGDVLVP